jgi:hypothetical protein
MTIDPHRTGRRPAGWRTRATLLAAALAVSQPCPATAAGDDDPMLARDCAPGAGCTQSWTLTSRLGHILEDYENRLGPRNAAYRLLGIEFTTGPRPRIWYPNFGSGPNSMIVQLTRRARRQADLALFQLAHEAFHLIAPIRPGTQASVFEEGLASFFATRYLEANRIASPRAFLGESAYRTAHDVIARTASRYTDFDAHLRRLRELNGGFSPVSPDEIRRAFPDIPARDARLLAASFKAGDG